MTNWLESLVKKNNIVLLKEDESCEMAEVKLNGTNLFAGNYWDFHRGCHGNILPEKYQWKGRKEFVDSLKLYILDLGKKVSVIEKRYKYNK